MLPPSESFHYEGLVSLDSRCLQLLIPLATSLSPLVFPEGAPGFGSQCRIGEGNGTPLQYSCLENPMDGGAWWAAVHGVAKSQTRLSDFTFMHWRRKWQPTPVFLPGESQGRGAW